MGRRWTDRTQGISEGRESSYDIGREALEWLERSGSFWTLDPAGATILQH